MLKVLEIFHSIDGEGLRTGELATFVRLAGCNLACRFCDTAYSIKPKDDTIQEMSVDEIISNVKYKNVTITGGEPLLQEETLDLIKALCEKDFKVNVETNGTIGIKFRHENLFYTVDYKCIYSGHNEQMNPEAFTNLLGTDVVKCVIASKEDFDDALAFFDAYLGNRPDHARPWLYLSPVFGKIQPVEIVDLVKENLPDMTKVRVQVQLHKIIWDPAARLV